MPGCRASQTWVTVGIDNLNGLLRQLQQLTSATSLGDESSIRITNTQEGNAFPDTGSKTPCFHISGKRSDKAL